MDGDKKKKEVHPNPRATCNPLSALTFTWVSKIFWTGFHRDLEVSDLYEPLKEHKSSLLGDKFERLWEEEKVKDKPSLLRVIVRCYGWECATYGIVLFFLECIVRIMQPLCIGILITYFQQTYSRDKNYTTSAIPSGNDSFYFDSNLLTPFNSSSYEEKWTQATSDSVVGRNSTLAQPLFLGRLIMYFVPNQSSISKEEAYWYAGAVIVCSAINVFMVHPYMMGIMHMGMKFRVACCSLIYRKSLKLSKTALGETTVGQVVNLLSNDVNRFDVAIIFFHYLWIGPLETAIATYLMWREIGESAVTGVVFMLLFIPFTAFLGKRISVLRLRTALRTDERVRLMNEIIGGIQVIKMYAWEIPFSKLVHLTRKREITEIRAVSYIRGVLISFIMFVTRVSLFLSLLTYVLLGKQITAGKVFVVTSYYNLLRQTMTVFFPQGISQAAEASISIGRLQKFLLYEETTKPLEDGSDLNKESPWKQQKLVPGKDAFSKAPLASMDSSIDSPSLMNGKFKKLDDVEKAEAMDDMTKVRNVGDKPAIVMTNVTAKWVMEHAEDTLHNITMKVRPGSLVAVIGPVGAGKSTLLNVLLKEVPLTSGTLDINGKVAYCSQEPWLFVGSVRQNILFGAPMDRIRYNMVIRKCALERDFSLFPRGDKTIVGERGVSLSGGQRARINLARAVYRQADIFLLDDPLSAVDTHVGRQLFENCIVNYLGNATRILITHQLQYLNEVDYIIILKEGSIAAEGTFEALQASGLDFAELLKMDTEEEEHTMESRDSEEKGFRDYRRHTSVSSASSLEDNTPADNQEEEQRSKGSVGGKVYGEYLRATGSWFTVFSMLGLAVFAQVLSSASDYWTSYWTNKEELLHRGQDSFTSTGMDEVLMELPGGHALSRADFIYIYTVLIVLLIGITLWRSFMFFWLATQASTNLHNNMFQSITRGTMRFFFTNPSGRILNRFSKDMGSVDEMLPSAMIDVLQIGLSLIGIVIVVIIVNYWLIFPTLGIAVIFYLLRVYFLSTSRSIKRLEGVTRSPVFSHLNASLQGMTTIRAFGAQHTLEKEFDAHQDLHSSAWYLFLATSRAFGFWLDVVCIIYLACVTLSFLIISGDNMGGNVGLAITQAMGLTGMFQWGMRQSAEVENQMTSVERVIEYTDIDKEAPLESSPEHKPEDSWPDKGEIIVKNVWLRYAPDGDPALRGLEFSLMPGEKLGIVGRTGAGKSSIIAAMFRLAYIDGTIKIDNVDTSNLGLHDLRSKLSIIPQEPVLFSGSMRKNLDPFDQYSDEVLWKALEEVEMKDVVVEMEAGLNSKVAEGGTNLSVGQRQLVCLARAIVRKDKILIMDEATANVDPQTDALIQTTIRQKFSDCTVLTIAHRLHTVMDSDKVLVMDAGRAVEFEHPHMLLQNSEGMFRGMVNQTGRTMSETLMKIAQQCYERRETLKKMQ